MRKGKERHREIQKDTCSKRSTDLLLNYIEMLAVIIKWKMDGLILNLSQLFFAGDRLFIVILCF